MACQKERPLNPKCKVNCVMQKDCSSWALEEAKTKPKPNADDLVNKQLEIFTANETTGETYIRWIPPADPNEMILKYTLQITTSLGTPSQHTIFAPDMPPPPKKKYIYIYMEFK